MAAENPQPRERILKVADRLFYADGVRATGTEKIMELAEVAKATFYRHFPSKDELVLAYLDRRKQFFWDYIKQPKAPATIHEALRKIDALVNHPDVGSCPFLRVASEYPDPEHPFHCSVREYKDSLLEYLGKLLENERKGKRSLAAELLTLIDGALSIRLVYGASRHVPLLSYAKAIIDSSRIAD
jgi:AcrR family transcriptional regulator